MTAVTVADRVRAVLADAPVIDGPNDLAWALRHRVGYDFDKLDIAVDQSAAGLHTDLPRLRAGGVGAQFWSVYVPCALSGDAAVAATLEQIDAVPALLAELASRGWSDVELAKLTWHNALRVLRATESAAAKAQRTRGPSLATFAELDLPAAP